MVSHEILGLSHNNIQVSNEGLPILVAHFYKNNWRNLLKKLLPVHPKIASRRKRRRRKGNNNKLVIKTLDYKAFCVTRRRNNSSTKFVFFLMAPQGFFFRKKNCRFSIKKFDEQVLVAKIDSINN